MSVFDKTRRDPVDKTAALVFAKGVKLHHEPPPRFAPDPAQSCIEASREAMAARHAESKARRAEMTARMKRFQKNRYQ